MDRDAAQVMRDLLRRPLAKGAHSTGKEQCVMEKVALLWAVATNRSRSVVSDLPECTNEVVAKVAQRVNDDLSDTERQRLNALVPRLLRARRTSADPRVNVRLAIWAARRVLHLVRDEDRALCERAIDAAQAWLDDPSRTTAAARAADAAYAASADAADAAYAAAYAAARAAAADAAAACVAAYAASAAAYDDAAAYVDDAADACAAASYADAAAQTPIAFLTALLDAWEEAVTKEGEDLYIPREWEDEALAFVAELTDR